MKERHAQGSDPGIRGNPGNPGNPGSGTRIHERHSLLLGLRQGPPPENPGKSGTYAICLDRAPPEERQEFTLDGTKRPFSSFPTCN